MGAKRNIRGSVLPSSNNEVLKVKEHANGIFQVRVLESLDTHGLYFQGRGREGFSLLVVHPNSFSCAELADRIIAVWKRKGRAYLLSDVHRALEQYQYILDCGGLAVKRATIEAILANSH